MKMIVFLIIASFILIAIELIYIAMIMIDAMRDILSCNPKWLIRKASDDERKLLLKELENMDNLKPNKQYKRLISYLRRKQNDNTRSD